jgi:hypothetical protein
MVSEGKGPVVVVLFSTPSVEAIVVPTELELCIVILKKKKQKKSSKWFCHSITLKWKQYVGTTRIS